VSYIIGQPGYIINWRWLSSPSVAVLMLRTSSRQCPRRELSRRFRPLLSIFSHSRLARARAACRRLSLRSSDARRFVARFRLSFVLEYIYLHILPRVAADVICWLFCLAESVSDHLLPSQTTTPKALHSLHRLIPSPTRLAASPLSQLCSPASPPRHSSPHIAVGLLLPFPFSVHLAISVILCF
jgi:hypothetical protein